jgi:hypothetical protein
MRKLYQTLLVGIVFATLLGSTACSVERKIAKQYINKADSVSIMVLFPSNVFVVNEKATESRGSFLFAEAQQDTSLLNSSLLLPLLNDDSILQPFRTSFLKELKQYRFNVYELSQMEEFMKLSGKAYFLNIAQIELQEYLTVYEDAITVGEQVYTKSIYLNGINIGSWFEVSTVDSKEGENYFPVLFATHDLTDRWNGYFTQKFLTGEIEYRLNIDTLTTADVKTFASYLGRLYGAYTFDYLMNKEITKKVPSQNRTDFYYRYDPYKQMIFITEEDKFVEIE